MDNQSTSFFEQLEKMHLAEMERVEKQMREKLTRTAHYVGWLLFGFSLLVALESLIKLHSY